MEKKKHSYELARGLVKFTFIIALVQILAEVIAVRDPDFYWIFPLSMALFISALIYSLVLVGLNAKR